MSVTKVALGATILVLLGRMPVFAALDVTSLIPLSTDICDRCGELWTLEVPLTITGTRPTGVVPRVIDVALGTRRDPEFKKAILDVRIDGPVGQPVLHMSIKQALLRTQGTYTVTVEFAATGVKPVTLGLQLNRPAAAIQPPGTIVVDRILGWPWGEPSTPDLKLIETANRTGLGQIRVLPPASLEGYSIDFQSPRACDSASDDQTSSSAVQVPAGSQRCVPYSFQGEFPLGSRSQTYSLMAAELSTPVPVTFEVRSRLARIYVIVIAAMGVLFSLLIKVLLQRRIEVEEARALALDLLLKVELDLRTHKDEKFQEDVTKPFDVLKRAAAATDVDAMKQARDDLDKEWREALSDLQKDRREVQEQLDKLRSITSTPWQIPVELLKPLTLLQTDSDRVRELLDGGLVTRAKRLAVDTSRVAVANVAAAIKDWQDAARDLFAFVQANSTLSAGVLTVFKDAVTSNSFSTSDLQQLGSLDELIQALTAATDDRRGARRIIRTLNLALQQEVDRAAEAFGRSPDQLPGPSAAISTLTNLLFEFADAPPTDRSPLIQALSRIQQEWREALEAELGGPLSAPIAALLREQRFVEAAAAVAATLRGESDSRQKPIAGMFLPPTILTDGDPTAPIRTFTTDSAPLTAPAPLARLQIRTRRQIAAAKLLQTSLICVFAMLVGYGLFAAKFIGDYLDFIMIFFWAFGLDLTADAIAKIAPTSRNRV